jgi:hypothetical protein
MFFPKFSIKSNINLKWSPGSRGASESDQSGGGTEEISQ